MSSQTIRWKGKEPINDWMAKGGSQDGSYVCNLGVWDVVLAGRAVCRENGARTGTQNSGRERCIHIHAGASGPHQPPSPSMSGSEAVQGPQISSENVMNRI